MFSAAVVIMALFSQHQQLESQNELVWSIDEVSVEQVDQGLYQVSVPDFSSVEDGMILLPERTVMVPVPPGESFSVRVVPSGVRSLGEVPVIAALELDEN
ncbi:MAG: hypothetical protein KAH31_07240, partial [Candidatus Sabulitectum sp.]|nr:hypothetical protein [Candidatus Sabulitectum sp.]